MAGKHKTRSLRWIASRKIKTEPFEYPQWKEIIRKIDRREIENKRFCLRVTGIKEITLKSITGYFDSEKEKRVK